MERRRATGLRADRQQKFSKEVRKAALENGRKLRDAERARMETYRRLCEAEGIQSKRLEEYDRARDEERTNLGKKLEEVDYDQSLTNNEKKRRKYNLKRKFAATTITEVVGKRDKKNFATAKVEEIQHRRETEKQEKETARRDRDHEKKRRMGARKERNALFSQRTSRGQPVMSSRVESLLQKITK